MYGVELTEGVYFDLGVVIKTPPFIFCEDVGLCIVDEANDLKPLVCDGLLVAGIDDVR